MHTHTQKARTHVNTHTTHTSTPTYRHKHTQRNRNRQTHTQIDIYTYEHLNTHMSLSAFQPYSSMFIFSSTNPFRCAIHAIVTFPLFDVFIMLVSFSLKHLAAVPLILAIKMVLVIFISSGSNTPLCCVLKWSW